MRGACQVIVDGSGQLFLTYLITQRSQVQILSPLRMSRLVGGGSCQAMQRACLARPLSAGRLDLLSLT
jgi:hypothetical protein